MGNGKPENKFNRSVKEDRKPMRARHARGLGGICCRAEQRLHVYLLLPASGTKWAFDRPWRPDIPYTNIRPTAPVEVGDNRGRTDEEVPDEAGKA